jgi:hypothetical protein
MGFHMVTTSPVGATMSKDNELALDLFMLGYERNELVHMLNEATSLIESLRNELDSIKSELHITQQELWKKQ